MNSDKPSVRLESILGIRPGIYLSVFYGLVLALLIFFFLFFPGLENPGSYVYFDAYPGSMSVKVDGVFAGIAPGTIFVKKGNRKIELFKPFFDTQSARVDVPGRIFATLIFPSRMKLTYSLAVSDLTGLTDWALDDFSRNQSIPQIISDAAWAAYGTQKAGNSDKIRNDLYDFLYKCMFFITSENQLSELLKASCRVSSSGTFLTTGSFLSLLQKIVQLKENLNNSPAWILLTLSREHARSISSSSWISRHFADYRDVLSQYYRTLSTSGAASGGGAVTVVDGIIFHGIPAGILIMGRDDDIDALGKSIDPLLPHPVSIDSFFLSETEVTYRQYKAFLDHTPFWRPSNRAELQRKGLVNENYLKDWIGDEIPSGRDLLPLTCVSYHAAAAYCDWFTSKVRIVFPGFIARPPREAEWEWAARGNLRGMPYPLGEKAGKSVFFEKGIAGPSKAGSSEPNGYGVRDMMGNAWEWCAGGFGPADYLLSSLDPHVNAKALFDHPITDDRPVRGGGWNSMRELVRVYTRGAQPSSWCTPYLGFRVAIARP